ncbi:MAG: hypothetical protein ABSF82_06625 [Candidatus Bathyarchaeia archaeon]
MYYGILLTVVATLAETCPACGSREKTFEQRDTSEIRLEYVYAFEEVALLRCTNCQSLWWDYS